MRTITKEKVYPIEYCPIEFIINREQYIINKQIKNLPKKGIMFDCIILAGMAIFTICIGAYIF